MQIPKVSSSIVHKYLSDPRFKKEFEQSYTVDRSHDIPYVAGYSTDNKKVFVDRHFNKMMDGKDIEPYIFIHEKCETRTRFPPDFANEFNPNMRMHHGANIQLTHPRWCSCSRVRMPRSTWLPPRKESSRKDSTGQECHLKARY